MATQGKLKASTSFDSGTAACFWHTPYKANSHFNSMTNAAMLTNFALLLPRVDGALLQVRMN
jgi:hypothetical protein